METVKFNKDEHYGKLNERFDIRASELGALGFKYERVPVLEIAVFTKTKFGKVHTISAGVVICADEIVWQDYLDRAKNFANS